ncbi:MAG TPA: GspE/PulE family protein [Patescibacteria group bacterium]|nr:GspE/PulE family protein [Patescibacteria group bacterium]
MPPTQKASSIEDLLKKAAPSSATNTSNARVTAAPAPAPMQKSTPSTGKKAASASKTEVLAETMEKVRLQDKEREAEKTAADHGMPYIALRGFAVMPEALALIPKAQAEDLKTVAFLKSGDNIRLATNQPSPSVEALVKQIAKNEHANVQLYFASEDGIAYGLDLYRMLPEEKEIVMGYRIEQSDLEKYAKEISNLDDLQKKITEVSTTDVVTLILGAAIKAGASDIHIEAEEADVKIRFRLDGILHDTAKLPKDAWKQMISRLKLLSEVKINVEDVPQDGRITIYLPEEKIDIRVSFLPTAFGESVVMRLLRPKAVALDFENLGVRGRAFDQLKQEIERPNGMIITTGPTGSGKTTTLYAILKKLNDPKVKIITLEDPIEYKLEGINQSQIDHSKHYDFARGLRSILRQDPDVVMVGEIRDLETAEISIQAALTGHLVVSTIHTNSAAGAIPRFLSMGVKPFLLAPSLNAIIGQRLVRRLCPDCKVPTKLDPAWQKQVDQLLGTLPEKSGIKIDKSKLNFMGPGKGCPTCNNTGFKGRIGIYEIFAMTKEIEAVILSNEVSEYKIQELAVKDGMITMAQDGILKALDGITTVDEILRVANVDSTLLEPVEGPPPIGEKEEESEKTESSQKEA